MKLCFLCGKKIGLLRSFVDQQYCSPEHRKEARLASSQAYRDEDDLENWAVAKRNKKGQLAKPAATVGQNASVIVFLAVGGLLVLALMLPGPGGPSAAFPSVSHDPAVKRGIVERIGNSFSEMVRSSAPVTLQHDFSKGMTDWTTAAVKSVAPIDDPKDWLGGTREASNNAPSRSVLHIWERSANLQNYQLEFQGQMERKTLSFAFRASDGGNYYANKLVINKSGPGPNAELIRWAVVGGHPQKPERKNVPAHVEAGTDLHIRVTVQDDRYLTYLNAQLIGNWVDSRLKHGGIGFFEDSNEPQKVDWVSVSERDSFIGRMLAHFSLFIIPTGY